MQNADRVAFGDDCWLRDYVHINGRSEQKYGIQLGSGVIVRNGAYLDSYGGTGMIEIGDRAGLGQYVYIGGNGGVQIGADAMISGHTYIVAATHVFVRSVVPYQDQGESRRGIVIGNNAWVAANCVVTDGVTIGDGAVIGAGSVVTQNIPAYTVAVGTPARVIRTVPAVAPGNTGEEFAEYGRTRRPL